MDENTPTYALVIPLGGGAPLKVLVPRRAKLGQRVAAMVWPSASSSHTVLVAVDPQKHPETGLDLAFYGRIIEIAC